MPCLGFGVIVLSMEPNKTVLDRLGEWIAGRLESESSGYHPFTPSDPVTLLRILRPGDILLVEGNQKVSAAIKYLTQSTWSHATLYVGDALIGTPDERDPKNRLNRLIEVELGEGCQAVPLAKYESFNTRICRPVGLSRQDCNKVVQFMVGKIGTQYDTRNIIDLARYLFPTPPIPVRFRRRLLALGSGEPTRAICPSLVAQAFQSVQYPILPSIDRIYFEGNGRGHLSTFVRKEILHIRHHSLFAPRDFDLSPFFQVIKPTLEEGFDYKALHWSNKPPGEGATGKGREVVERVRG